MLTIIIVVIIMEKKGINDEEYDNTGYKNDLNGFVVLSYSP